MSVDTSKPPHQCEACIQGKAHILPFPKESERKYKNIGDMIYTDLWGKAWHRGIGGELYFISFTDASTTRSRVRFLKNKEGPSVLKTVMGYAAYIKNQTGRLPCCFRFDNGKEYVNAETLEWLTSQGIEYELTAPYSSAQNGVAERLNRTIVERARTMIIASGLSWHMWPEAVNYAFYLKNISPTSALNGDITPFEAFTHRKPDISNIHEFGAKIWVLQQDGKVHKLMAKAQQFIFVGLSEHSRGFRYYMAGQRAVQISRNVIFQDPKTVNDEYIVPTPFPSLDEGEHGDKHPDSVSTPTPLVPIAPLPILPPSPTLSSTSTLTPLTTPASTPPPSPSKTPTPKKAPKDINSAINTDNIIEGRRTRSDFALAITEATSLSDDPQSVDQARSRPEWAMAGSHACRNKSA